MYIYVVCVVTSLHHFAYQWFNLSKLRHHGHHVEQVTRAEECHPISYVTYVEPSPKPRTREL